MKPDLAPITCLDFEPEEARALLWLPLAVRHKLDEQKLKLSLHQWQWLDLETRAIWLRCPSGDDFRRMAIDAGARELSEPVAKAESTEVVFAARVLGLSGASARLWLKRATPFALYALGKLSSHRLPNSGHVEGRLEYGPATSCRQQTFRTP